MSYKDNNLPQMPPPTPPSPSAPPVPPSPSAPIAPSLPPAPPPASPKSYVESHDGLCNEKAAGQFSDKGQDACEAKCNELNGCTGYAIHPNKNCKIYTKPVVDEWIGGYMAYKCYKAPFPALNGDFGANGMKKGMGKVCQGDCDKDSDCDQSEGPLVCLDRPKGSNKPVPGCVGSADGKEPKEGRDYCCDPTFEGCVSSEAEQKA
jgi:hypothetical protein